MYLTRFDFPGESAENNYITGFRSTCWDSFYPFGIFPQRELESVTFEPITIFCGGNGSGKTTALNVTAHPFSGHLPICADAASAVQSPQAAVS